MADSLLIDTSHTINAGSYGNLRGFPTTVYDGSDGTAVFTVEVLPGDGYTVDPNHGTAHVAVQDVDPLPVLGLRSSSSVEVSEGVGTAENMGRPHQHNSRSRGKSRWTTRYSRAHSH